MWSTTWATAIPTSSRSPPRDSCEPVQREGFEGQACLPSKACDRVSHPDIRVLVAAFVPVEIHSHGLQGAGDDVRSALREAHARPLLPLGNPAGDDQGFWHDLQRLGPEPVVDAEPGVDRRSEEHTSELQSRQYLVCRLLLEKKKTQAT